MKTSQTRNFNGRIIPYDTYATEILQRLEKVVTAPDVGYGFIVQAENDEATVAKLLRNFERTGCEVHALKVSVQAGTVFVVTIPESHRRHLTYRLHESLDESLITEFSDLDMLFKLAAPLTSVRRLTKDSRTKSRLILSAAKNKD